MKNLFNSIRFYFQNLFKTNSKEKQAQIQKEIDSLEKNSFDLF